MESEFIFLGTGTSSCVPLIHCLTEDPKAPGYVPCHTCLSSLTPEGKRNHRRNTSGLLRIRKPGRDPLTIVIDAGKTFQAAAIEWFPKYGLRRIDALLITHAHADAMNGLDDLRAWTLRGRIQPHIDVYCNQDTFREVERSFPYLVSKAFASGGGDVPEFVWHIIEDNVPFEITDSGVWVTPFFVHHGRVFSKPPDPMPTPGPTHPSTPINLSKSPEHAQSDSNAEATVLSHTLDFATAAHSSGERTIIQPQPLKLANASSSERTVLPLPSTEPNITPYLCFGFLVHGALAYISDTNFIPPSAWAVLDKHPGLPLAVLDTLYLQEFTSHFGIKSAMDAATRLGPRRTYLTGMGHEVSHEEYETLCEVASGQRGANGEVRDEKAGLRSKAREELTEKELEGIDLALGALNGATPWVRPGHDGLRVVIDANGDVRDGTCP
ncbi:beta-lactamase-like protein [Schizophyllum amplum]|uniref:Beta-lactamase-like protein n=1 Tax=Schizophyllum amplum TaxID=97359 RepID=A0A550CMJ2_9AGAR|nr:beta-lactamase-like protein [Auriculariopsis ampla]